VGLGVDAGWVIATTSGATPAPGARLARGDVEENDLLGGEGADLAISDLLADTERAAGRAWSVS
jgi:hypothetical protein